MKELISDGSNIFIFDIIDNGLNIVISGWNTEIRNYKNGKVLLMSIDGGKSGSHYRIVKTDNPMNPKDQYFHKCEFISKKWGKYY